MKNEIVHAMLLDVCFDPACEDVDQHVTRLQDMIRWASFNTTAPGSSTPGNSTEEEDSLANVLRQDIAVEVSLDDIMCNAPCVEHDYFVLELTKNLEE